MTEREFANRRREATAEAMAKAVRSHAAGNKFLAQHWLHEALRLRNQVFNREPDIRVRTPYDAAIQAEHDR